MVKLWPGTAPIGICSGLDEPEQGATSYEATGAGGSDQARYGRARIHPRVAGRRVRVLQTGARTQSLQLREG